MVLHVVDFDFNVLASIGLTAVVCDVDRATIVDVNGSGCWGIGESIV